MLSLPDVSNLYIYRSYYILTLVCYHSNDQDVRYVIHKSPQSKTQGQGVFLILNCNYLQKNPNHT